jgi:TRAP-type C4-dicarboxylate transport system permease small subunit
MGNKPAPPLLEGPVSPGRESEAPKGRDREVPSIPGIIPLKGKAGILSGRKLFLRGQEWRGWGMKKIYGYICKQEMLIAQWALGVLSLLVFLAAVGRTSYYPLNWAMDAATFLFAWTVFLGADAAMRKDRLFSIELITSRLPQKAQLYIKFVNYIIIVIFLVGMIGYGLWLSYTTRLRTFQGIPGFSYTWVTLSVPIGCALMLITAILKIKTFLRAFSTGESLAKREEGMSGEII